MNELIPIGSQTLAGCAMQTINARELHGFLGSKQQFADWIKSRIEKYGFVEHLDFVIVRNSTNNAAGRPSIDYHLTLNMAKELSMIERTDKGKQARLYFIECERTAMARAAVIPNNLPDALRLAADIEEQRRLLEAKIEQDKPRVELAMAIEQSERSLTIEDYAKMISKCNGFVIGRNNLFAALRKLGFITKHNLPYQTYIDQGFFEVTVAAYQYNDRIVNHLQTMVTGKGQAEIFKRLKKSGALKKHLNRGAVSNGRAQQLSAN